jgi:membrane peptidoglycan carboxypeptidase
MSAETAAMVTTVMEGVVDGASGTGKAARLEGYHVAGKTGTAAKLVNGRYSHTDYNVSFVGFVPSREPVLTILVVVDTPRNGSAYGGTVAAPIFQRIADAALRQLAVPPTINPPPVVLAGDFAGARAKRPDAAGVRPARMTLGGSPIMPDVRGLSARDALRVLTAAGLVVSVSGSGFVDAQTPAPGDPIDAGDASRLELRRQRTAGAKPPGTSE